MEEIATMEEIEEKFKDEWVLIEVLEEDEFEAPTKGRVIAHSKSRDEIYDLLKDKTGDISVFFAGEIPKKGYAVAF
jgi:hypothetical protein